MTRKEVRANAMKLLYAYSMRDDTMEALYAVAEADEDAEIQVNDAVRELTDGALSHLDELDEKIQQFSPKRSISRIPKLSLAVLRLAIYEILYDDGTPVNAAVSEAVLLAEQYSPAEEDVRFINGLLGAFARSQQPAEEPAESAAATAEDNSAS